MGRDSMPWAERHTIIHSKRTRLTPGDLRFHDVPSDSLVRTLVLRPHSGSVFDRHPHEIGAKLRLDLPDATVGAKEVNYSVANSIWNAAHFKRRIPESGKFTRYRHNGYFGDVISEADRNLAEEGLPENMSFQLTSERSNRRIWLTGGRDDDMLHTAQRSRNNLLEAFRFIG